MDMHSANTVADIVQRRSKKAGLDETSFSRHSMRVGRAIRAAMNVVRLWFHDGTGSGIIDVDDERETGCVRKSPQCSARGKRSLAAIDGYVLSRESAVFGTLRGENQKAIPLRLTSIRKAILCWM